LGLTTKLYTINPKDRSVIELYGVLDPNTRDWTDGLLSNIFRDINKPTDKNERKYVVFDGDVDALWVENMNSVMDDNRLLTLANGERIRLQRHCALLFEVYLCTEPLTKLQVFAFKFVSMPSVPVPVLQAFRRIAIWSIRYFLGLYHSVLCETACFISAAMFKRVCNTMIAGI
jgi:hypothetical protein